MKDKIDRLKQYLAKKECGSRGKYMAGCRCVKCRAANSAYQVERKRKRREGHGNPIVDASPAREHMRRLSKRGIGYKTVAEYSGIGKSTLFQVMRSERLQIRKNTLDAILAVDTTCFSAGTVLPANETWKRIKWMKSEGFTEADIAKRMGRRKPYLTINAKRVTGRTAIRIERIYRKARLGE